ncbi:S8 family serine peptidase [Streptomyces sp. NBC_01483]|uniref:S8 family serine peptidase n=1 Tax=Streptomyces sp. NBC_01483 TaxID=2903883 RepID=UPI002E36BE00|nr:S8 family serine peptidase [Streptomyces sp. NBC_01483]
MRAVGAAVGALAAVTVGFAPSAAAYDAQSKEWYLAPMQAEQMWKVSTGKGVKVAVIDTGVNASTPSLKGQVLTDEVPQAVAYHATNDYAGHGTSMAELIAGTGAGGGLKGLAPGAKIVPYRIQLEGLKSGAEKDKTPKAWEALRAAADTDAKIISMSFGGMTTAEDKAAVNYAASKGKLLIAAVGNNAGEGKSGYIDLPAAYPYVIGVSSIDSLGTVSKFSSYGNYVDLSAPGEGIPGWCDAKFRSYCNNRNGTSPATALTSASAALIWSAHPNWTANQVTRSLIDTASRTWAKDNPSKYAGYGAIRPRKVLENPDYNAGPANADPLSKENGGKPAAEGSVSPSPSASALSQAPNNASGGETSAAGSSTNSSGNSNSLWIALGAAAAVIVVGGVGVAVLRARRAR